MVDYQPETELVVDRDRAAGVVVDPEVDLHGRYAGRGVRGGGPAGRAVAGYEDQGVDPAVEQCLDLAALGLRFVAGVGEQEAAVVVAKLVFDRLDERREVRVADAGYHHADRVGGTSA